MPKTAKEKSKRATTITLAIVFTISVTGYFVGMRQTVRETDGYQVSDPLEAYSHHAHDEPEAHLNVRIAPDYSQIAAAGFGPNADFKSHLSDLRSSPGDSAHPNPAFATEADLRAKRQSRRAYDGAPPIVPHPVAQGSAAVCIACHSEARQIGDVVAPAISHPVYTSCTQCHVSSKGLGSEWNTSEYDLHTGNRFTGDHQPRKGTQAYPDAPHTIPHTLHMRQNCLSCHGPLGTSPIRTDHPERQSCTQCHVPSADVAPKNFGESPFPYIEALIPTEN